MPRVSGEFYPSLWDYVDAPPGSRVLLAEGDGDLCHFLAAGLRRNGHAVLAAVDGEETINVLSSVARGDLPPPDAVVLDSQLAIHSGLELLGAMRRAGWETPVILMSSRVDPRVREAAERFEVFTCLNKPLSAARLTRTVKEALGKTPEPAA